MSARPEHLGLYHWPGEGPSFVRWAKTVLPMFDGIIVWDLSRSDRAARGGRHAELRSLQRRGLLRTVRPIEFLPDDAASRVAAFLAGQRLIPADDGTTSRWDTDRASFRGPPPGLVDWDLTYASRYWRPPAVSDHTSSLAAHLWPALRAHLPAHRRDLPDSITSQPYAWSSISAALPWLLQAEMAEAGVALDCTTYDHDALRGIVDAIGSSESLLPHQCAGAQPVLCDGDDVDLGEVLAYRDEHGALCRAYLAAAHTADAGQDMAADPRPAGTGDVRRTLRSSYRKPFRHVALGMVRAGIAIDHPDDERRALPALVRQAGCTQLACFFLTEVPTLRPYA